MPDFINIIILGIIEGITEFLPISSTGHLLIAQHWLPRQSDLFNVVIQSGAVLAVIPLFSARFRRFIFQWQEPATRDYLLKLILAFGLTGCGGLLLEHEGSPKLKAKDVLNPASFLLRMEHPAETDGVSLYISTNLSSGTKDLLAQHTGWNSELQQPLLKDLNRIIQSGPIYESQRFANANLSAEALKLIEEKPDGKDLVRLNRLLLHDAYPFEIAKKKQFKLPEELTPVAWALLVGGIIFLIVEFSLRGKKMSENVTWIVAVAVGLGQLVTIIFPGASRSGTTIMISLLLGLSRPAATEFSFLVSIPSRALPRRIGGW